MRINQFVANATNISRRKADQLIIEKRITINDNFAKLGQLVKDSDVIKLDNQLINAIESKTLVLLNKPTGYVCSKDGQGNPTIYELLPDIYQNLKYIGRLDKESTGLLLLSNDGELINKLSHPSFNKLKVYDVTLDKHLTLEDKYRLENGSIKLDGKPSKLILDKYSPQKIDLIVKLYEGRNRQIRRTFEMLGYHVNRLNRIEFGEYKLSQLKDKLFIQLDLKNTTKHI